MDKCYQHNKDYEFFCYECNLKVCSRCIKTHSDHKTDHIDDITDSLIGDESNLRTKDSLIETRKSLLWAAMKDAATKYHSLLISHSTVSQEFSNLHEYLVIEEHKTKKPIDSDLDQIKKQLDSLINDLKSLNNITLINHSTSTHSSSTSSPMALSDEEDTTDKYLLDNIILSIQKSESLGEFTQSNINTLFSNCTNNRNKPIDKHFKQELFDLLYKHNTQFNLNSKIDNIHTNIYKVEINQSNIKNAIDIIHQSIKLELVVEPLQNEQQDIVVKKQPFIVSADKDEGLSFINIDTKETEVVPLDYNLHCSYGSMATVRDHIYIFGGSHQKQNHDKYCRFSILTKTIDLTDTILGVDLGRSISVCYDGNEHIYLVNGYNEHKGNYLNRIDRFNINTRRFEKFYKFVNGERGVNVVSFFYRGCLFTVPYNRNAIVQFDPVDKTVKEIKSSKLMSKQRAACTDGNGNLYTHSDDNRFVRINLDTLKVDTLEPLMPISDVLSMQFYRASESESVIYLIGGGTYGNHKYIIENNSWEEYDNADNRTRKWCGSQIVELP